MSELVIPVLAMLLLVMGEACILQLTGRQKVDWRDVIFNLNSGHIMLWLFRCLEVLSYSLVLHYCSMHLLENWSAVWLWLFALLAWDFGFYWLHRLHHRFALLWAVHVVHHQGEHFNLSLGVRNSWYSSLTSIPFFTLLAVLGVPLSVFLTVSVVHYSVQLFNHNALTPRLGWLENILVTPAHHRVHHINDRRYADKNFGGTFIFWDKLFGSFCQTPATETLVYGVKGLPPSTNPLRESNQPFLRLLGLSTTTATSKREHYPLSILISGALLLFVLVAGYIHRYGYDITDISLPQFVFFVLLAAGSVALGGISDGRRWGIIGWCLITLLIPLLFLGCWGWWQPFWVTAMLVLAGHGLFSVGYVRQRKCSHETV